MTWPTFSAFVRIRPDTVEDELRSDTVDLEEVVALAAAPLPPDDLDDE